MCLKRIIGKKLSGENNYVRRLADMKYLKFTVKMCRAQRTHKQIYHIGKTTRFKSFWCQNQNECPCAINKT